MSCFGGIQHHEWLCSDPISISKDAPYWLNQYISVRRMKLILSVFCYMDDEPTPKINNSFFSICKFVRAWKFHMTGAFLCS